ncbi:MAG: VWA domain-containing protein [Planctomycetota bacterium]
MSESSANATESNQSWQGEWVQRKSTVTWLRTLASRCLWPSLVVLSIGLFAAFVWLLTLAPKRTPVLVFEAAPYAWPLAPTEFSREDVESLAELDGQTITLSGTDVAIRSRQDLLRQLSRSLEQAAGHARSTPRVVYLKLHGVAGSFDENAYLIPPAGSTTDPETWVRLNEVLDLLQTTDSSRHTLLVLDCQHMRANWNLGLKSNRFVTAARERIEEALSVGRCENTAVLLTCDSDQHVQASAHLQQSVCGHFFRLGLAGAADTSKDGWVSLRELESFVCSNVSDWTLRRRGLSQTPVLFASREDLDFRLARNLHAKALSGLFSDANSEATPNVPRGEIDSMWEKLERIRDDLLYQNEPIAFRDLEGKLLSLEQLSAAGAGYKESAVSLNAELRERFTEIEERKAAASRSSQVQTAYSVLSNASSEYPTSLTMHSAPLSRLFGETSPSVVSGLNEVTQAFIKQPNKQTLSSAIKQFKRAERERFATAQFLRMLSRYQTPRFWNRREEIARLVQLQQEVHELEGYHLSGGIPADGRLHSWVRLMLQDVDAARRDAEDWAFLSDTRVFSAKLDEFESRLSRCRRAVDVLRKAYSTCDRGFASLGHLARWADTPSHVEFATKQDALKDSILVAFRRCNELANELEAAGTDPYAGCDRASELAVTVDGEVDELESRLRRRAEWLLSQATLEDPRVVMAIEGLLACPTMDLALRGRLQDAKADLIKRLFETGGQTLDSNDTVWEQIAGWKQHPLDLVLPGKDEPWTERVTRLVDAASRRLEECRTATSIGQRRELSVSLANELRCVAPMSLAQLSIDPFSEFRTNDLQSLLTWHANRSVGDFWGPAGRRRAFYDDAATGYCQAAAKLSDVSGGKRRADDEVVQLFELIDSTRQFLPNWLATSAGPGIRIDADQNIRSELTVLSNAPVDFAAPSGTASVTVRKADSAIEIAQVEPSDAVILPTIGGHYTMLLPDSVANGEDQLVAQAMFRGHEYGRPLRLAKLAGYQVEVTDEQAQSSVVAVTDGVGDAAIGFVIDGSASMGEELAEGKTKLAIAKAALNELLGQVAKRGDTRVSVHAFGHRAGWSTTQPVQVLRRPGLGAADQSVLPSRDVEAILQLSSFGPIQRRQLESRISSVKPWGQSPLYFAMEESLGQFDSQSAGSKRHLIVITDGENYQFSPPSENAFQPTTAQAVLARSQEVGVPIHILGFGVDHVREPAAVAEFEQLGNDSGGGFQTLHSATDLSETLEQLLLNPNYRVRSLVNQQRPDVVTRLGQEVRLQVGAAPTESFVVSVEGIDPAVSENVELEGGESIQLYVEQGELLSFPYDRNVAHDEWLVDNDGNQTGVMLRVHRPLRLASGAAVFEVSWQRSAAAGASDSNSSSPRWKPTPRAAGYWIEVQPCDKESKTIGVPFVFYDRRFVNDVSVPLARLTAEKWPRNAVKASVRVWTQPPDSGMALQAADQAPSDSSLSGVSESIEFDPLREEPFTLPNQAFIRMEELPANDRFAVRHRFIVRFDDPKSVVASIKVLPLGGSSGRFVRQFDDQQGIAVHTFDYEDARDAPERYRVTDRMNEIRGSWTTAEPSIVIDVPEPGGLLPASVSSARNRSVR